MRRLRLSEHLALLIWAGGLPLLGPTFADAPEAVALNERGLEHLHAGRAEEARRAFEQAMELEPEASVLQRNLAAALAALAEERRGERRALEAVDLLDRAIELHPERLRYRVLRGRARFESGGLAERFLAAEDFHDVLDADPGHLDALVNLGQIAYLERNLTEAVALWQQALDLQPDDPDVAARLAKARRELEVERAYETLPARHFLVRHAPSIPHAQAAAVLQICEEAYGDLSKRFEVYPDQIVVTLYTPEEFRTATRLFGWVAGLSDGTIRLTLQPAHRLDRVRGTIYHELTHHLVRALAPEAPVWLHEGLAQLSEGRSVPAAEARLRQSSREPQDRELSARILRERDPREVSRFYDLTLGFVHHLRGRHGDAALTRLLHGMGEGNSEEEALRSVYGASRGELFARWSEELLRGR